MTEKRFTYDNGFVCDNKTGYCYEMFKNRDGREMADLLNTLYDENQDLRKLLDIGETNAKAIIDVLNEQEQYKIKANALHEENEELKKRLDEVLKELYCKDRRLEELREDIECCDK